ncbi:MAG: mucoidy inhibitor MuiA family protein [Flavobacteriaceae bacterium]|nr:mucoidy inhibitor MuiA family protein [Flavobacteriaceae bacterium]
MKNYLFLLLHLLFLSLHTFGQTEISSKINKVKVFTQNAQITRNISFTTTSGNQEIVLTGISTYISPSSLQIQFSNSNSILLSAKYKKNYLLSKSNNKHAENLQKQLEDLKDELSWLNDKKNSLKGMEDILNKNQDLGNGNSSFTAQQVIQLSNSYELKYLEIRKRLRGLSKKEQSLKEKAANIQNQLNEVNAAFNKPSGNIILQIASKTSNIVTIKCKYMVSNAGWYPIYDIRSESVKKNIQLNYKATIYQKTGVDWENVSVIVSTGNPSQNNNRPILNPLYPIIYPRIIDENKEMLDEVVIVTNTSLTKSNNFVKRTQISENQLSVDFKILNKQHINSDGKENLIALKSYELKTDYIYHSVPKLNKSAFLLAKISDWSQYNLIAGKANIFFEGGFVGTSQINPQVTSNSLLISMGLDNSIVIERRSIKEFTSSKFIGANKKETIGYEFIVKNKKSVPIKIEILDQIPVSQNKMIQIVLEEKGSAKYSQNSGELIWTMDINARQTKKERFIYTVKYPKKQLVIGIK